MRTWGYRTNPGQMNLLLLKIIIPILVVIGLAEISRRINPLLGGILNGLPLGTGLTVYFIALEKGPAYILPGIPWGIAALSGSLLFCFVYYYISQILKTLPRPAVILISALSGVGAFTGLGFILKQLQFDLLGASFIFMFFYIMNLVIIKKLRIVVLQQPKNSSFPQIVFRAVLVGCIIVVLTTLGVLSGSEWAGIVSSFPATLFALLAVLHYEEEKSIYVSVIYGFSFSIFVLFVFYLLCAVLLPVLDLNISFLIIYGISVLYIIFFNMVIKTILKRFYSEIEL
jgi:hypothetical protein